MHTSRLQTISIFNTHHRYRIRKKLVEGYVRRVVGKRRSNVSVVFVNSRYCKSINKKYLNHDYVTDVMSFTLEERPTLEGEIYVNLDRARQQAREYNVSVANELARLVIHGTLHLIGYDDQKERERRKMKIVEERHVRYWFSEN